MIEGPPAFARAIRIVAASLLLAVAIVEVAAPGVGSTVLQAGRDLGFALFIASFI